MIDGTGVDAVKKRAERAPNFSYEEKISLIQFVGEHKSQLFGSAGKPGHENIKVGLNKIMWISVMCPEIF